MNNHDLSNYNLSEAETKLVHSFVWEGRPYLLWYQYRTAYSKKLLKADAPALTSLSKKGLIKMYEKDAKWKRYRLLI